MIAESERRQVQESRVQDAVQEKTPQATVETQADQGQGWLTALAEKDTEVAPPHVPPPSPAQETADGAQGPPQPISPPGSAREQLRARVRHLKHRWLLFLSPDTAGQLPLRVRYLLWGMLAAILLEAVVVLVLSSLPARGRHSTLPPLADSQAAGPSAATAVPAEQRSGDAQADLIVSATEGGQYATISEAVRHASPGARILVRPGVYQERIVVDRQLEIAGDGPREKIILRNGSGSVVQIKTDVATIRGLTIVRQGGIDDARACAVEVRQGRSVVEDCDVTSKEGAGIGVYGAATTPVFRRCAVHDSKYIGLFFYEGGRGVAEECEISGNDVGVGLKMEADPVLRRCKVHDNKRAGVAVENRSAGLFEGCTIHNTKQWGVAVVDRSAGVFHDCEIKDNLECGVLVSNNSEPRLRDCKISNCGYGMVSQNHSGGILEQCDVFQSTKQGILAQEEATPILRVCKVYQNKTGGLYAFSKAAPVAEDCEFRENGKFQVGCKEGGAPVLRRCKLHSGDEGLWALSKGAALVEQCEFFDFAKDAVYVESVATPGREENRMGIAAHGNPTLVACRIRDGKGIGIAFREDARATVSRCEISGHSTNIVVDGTAQPALDHCDIHSGTTDGVLIEEDAEPTFRDCDIHGSAKDNAFVRDKARPTFARCRLFAGKRDGLNAGDRSRGTLRDCEVYGNQGVNVALRGSSEWTLSGGTIHDARKNGLTFMEKAKGLALGCKIFGNAWPDVVARDEAEPLLRACGISAGKGCALWARGKCRAVVEQCEIFDTAELAVLLDDDSGTVLRNCTVRNGKEMGVRSEKHAEGQLIGCNFSAHGVTSLAMLGDSLVTVQHCRLHDSNAGALLAENARAAIWNCDLENNAVCGVCMRGAGEAVVEDCRFRGAAPAVVAENGKVTIHHCAVVGAAKEAWVVRAAATLSGSENTPALPYGSLPDSATFGAWRRWPFRLP